MKIEVIYSQWAAEGEVFGGGVHDLAKPTRKLLALVAGAEAAGSVRVLEATDDERARLDKAVQSQEDGEAAYAKAVESGEWHHGNLTQFVNDRETLLALDADPDSDVTLTDEQLAAVRSDLEQVLDALVEWYRAHPARKAES